jgi:hypothetical protein
MPTGWVWLVEKYWGLFTSGSAVYGTTAHLQGVWLCLPTTSSRMFAFMKESLYLAFCRHSVDLLGRFLKYRKPKLNFENDTYRYIIYRRKIQVSN